MLAATLSAADRSSWDEVTRLPSGNVVRVTDKTGKQTKGSFVSASANAIVLSDKSSQVSIDRANVRRIEKKPGHRVRNALIGAGIGLAAGIAIDQTLGTILRNEAGEDAGARALTILAPTAIFGGIGALTGGYRTIYSTK
jgi:hypothetical protein